MWTYDESGYQWEVCFALESHTFGKALKASGPTAALNLGFRLLSDGSLRVGYVVGSDGFRYEVVLPNHGFGSSQKGLFYRSNRHGIASSLTHANNKRAGSPSRDEEDGRSYYMEATRDALVQWLNENPTLTPGWLKWESRTLPRWRSQASLRRLISLWFSAPYPTSFGPLPERPSGAGLHRGLFPVRAEYTEIFERLLTWSRQDRHNHQHEAGNRRRSIAFRNNEYRRLGAQLGRRYATIKLVKYKKSDLVRKVKPEEGESQLESAQRRQFNVAAAAILVDAIKLGSSNNGARVIEVPATSLPASFTLKHYACGRLSESNPKTSIWLHCTHCNVDFDQDESAALNLLGFPFSGGEADDNG